MKHIKKYNEDIDIEPIKVNILKNFNYIDDMEISPNSKYFIVCANINRDDTWVWKFCDKEQNFIPVWSETYGDCSILGKDIDPVMKRADEWISGVINHQKRDILPELFLLKC